MVKQWVLTGFRSFWSWRKLCNWLISLSYIFPANVDLAIMISEDLLFFRWKFAFTREASVRSCDFLHWFQQQLAACRSCFVFTCQKMIRDNNEERRCFPTSKNFSFCSPRLSVLDRPWTCDGKTTVHRQTYTNPDIFHFMCYVPIVCEPDRLFDMLFLQGLWTGHVIRIILLKGWTRWVERKQGNRGADKFSDWAGCQKEKVTDAAVLWCTVVECN